MTFYLAVVIILLYEHEEKARIFPSGRVGMKKLYFIRHALTEYNVKGLYAGISETPLTDVGRKQAKKTGLAMNDKGIKIDLIISSPLGRTLETAQIVAKEIGYPHEKIVASELLTERNFGKLEGKAWSPHRKYEELLKFGIETNEELIKRVRKALDWIESQPADNVLVVSHGATGRALRSLVKEDFPMSHPEKLANAELYEWL
jgi:broad specificity phosphatase PhoE